MLKNIHEIFRPVNYYVYKGIKYIEETKLISEFFERHDITDEMIANINDMVVIFLYLVVAISVIANIIKNILKKSGKQSRNKNDEIYYQDTMEIDTEQVKALMEQESKK